MRFDYECVPVQSFAPVPMCGQTFKNDKNGIIAGPVDAQFNECKSRIEVADNKVMKIYIFGLDLDAKLVADFFINFILFDFSFNINKLSSTIENLIFQEDGLVPYEAYSGQDSFRYAFETCSNYLNVNLKTNKDVGNRYAAEIYFEG